MEISKTINGIIDHRKGRGEHEGHGHLQKVEEKITFLNNVHQALIDYDKFRTKALVQIENQNGDYYNMSVEDPTFEQKLIDASPAKAIEDVQKALNKLDELCVRFDRETINISVIGRAGQGKSRLLQSISGVDNAIIPADSGGDCTGAKSVICNAEGKLHAQIICYSEAELLEQVQRYIDELPLRRKLISASQIPTIDMGSVVEENLTNKQQSYYEKLLNFVNQYDTYSTLLGKNFTVDDKDEIRKYVAQYLLDGTRVYNYLAVKEVRIFTPFNFADAGKIMLVDTIGLGDTSIGLREKMIDTLINDSDAAIMLRRPDRERDGIREEDNNLYDMINDRMQGRDLEKWLFYVLNIYADNKRTGENLYEQIMRKFGKTLKTAFVEKIDCADSKAVETQLVLPMLECLATNLNDVDNSLMASANTILEDCYADISQLSGRTKALLNSSFAKYLNTGGLFDTLYEDELGLARRLEELNMRYKDHTRKCEEIEQEVRRSVAMVANDCPTADEIIEVLRSGRTGAHPSSVYETLSDRCRADISDRFDEINNSTIVNLQEGIKNEIVEVLRADDGGKLDMLNLNTDSDKTDNIAWLKALVGKPFTEEKSLADFPILKAALEDVLNYRLNIEGMLQYYVNVSLECMDPEEKGKFAQIDFSKAHDKEEEAQLIDQALLAASMTAANSLVQLIQGLLQIPYNSFYACIRKLRERIIYSKEGERELKNFYREIAPYIWKDKFETICKQQATKDDLKAVVNSFEPMLSRQQYIIKFEK